MERWAGMSAWFNCTDPEQRVTGLADAAASLRKGDLAVIPTDTVYGLAADAFSPPAVTGLLAAKGRERQPRGRPTRDHRRRRGGPARGGGRGIPGRRALLGRCPVHDRGPDRCRP